MASVSNRARGGEYVDPEDVLDMVLDDDKDLGGTSSSAESEESERRIKGSDQKNFRTRGFPKVTQLTRCQDMLFSLPFYV